MASDTGSVFGKIFVFCIVLGSIESNKIEIKAHNFENIVKNSRFSLLEKDNCTRNQKHALVLTTGHVLCHESFKTYLNFCMFQAADTFSGPKKHMMGRRSFCSRKLAIDSHVLSTYPRSL